MRRLGNGYRIFTLTEHLATEFIERVWNLCVQHGYISDHILGKFLDKMKIIT